MPSISGAQAFVLFKELKEKYGVKQTEVAAVIGVSRQAVTDMKAGRRRFTRVMAEKILLEFAGEPWADWLRARFDMLFTPSPIRFAIPGEPPSRGDVNHAEEERAPPMPASPQAAKRTGLPVLNSPCRGDPGLSSANTKKYAPIPDELSVHASGLTDSYILVIGFNSRDGRLRRGDQVLVLQDAERESEIMVIEHDGALRLARRVGYERAFRGDKAGAGDESDWCTLDSGMVISAQEAEPAGCVVGIVMALL
jgi:DNA-binding XRE family transcriptional regulator